jgi:hypothetical protein
MHAGTVFTHVFVFVLACTYSRTCFASSVSHYETFQSGCAAYGVLVLIVSTSCDVACEITAHLLSPRHPHINAVVSCIALTTTSPGFVRTAMTASYDAEQTLR